MSNKSGSTPPYLWIGLIVVVLIGAALVSIVRQTGSPPPVIQQVAPFALTNQLGQPVTLSDLRGSIWVANIIFTRCPGPCKQMSRRMAALQKRWAAESSVRFVSLTTDPDFDTPAVMKAYGEQMGADFSRWQFLTGTKQQIRDLAVSGLKLTAQDVDPAERTNPADLFLHSTISVVVDRRGRLRAGVEALENDSESRFDEFIRQLLKE